MSLKNLLKIIVGTVVSVIAVSAIFKNTNKEKLEIESRKSTSKTEGNNTGSREKAEESQSISEEEMSDTINNEEDNLIEEKNNVMDSMSERHKEAADMMEEALSNIMHDEPKRESSNGYTQQDLDDMVEDLEKLLQ